MKIITILSVLFVLASCGNRTTGIQAQQETESQYEKIVKTDAEWQAELTPMEYKVLRKAGTERSFTGDLWDHKEDGVYTCRGCALPLFDSQTKSATCA